jgi:sugar/nucleoside kinase (ribokinase family)
VAEAGSPGAEHQGEARVVCVGLATLDVVQYARGLPAAGDKATSEASWVGAGGPAANAAATIGLLGGPVTLIAPVGDDRVGQLARADLERAGVDVVVPAAWADVPTTVSSAWVDLADGDRAVLSTDAAAATAAEAPADGEAALADDVAAVLLDGCLPRLSLAVADAARRRGMGVVLDGGSWKPVLAELLPLVDHAICAARFAFPDADDQSVADRLTRLAATVGDLAAITDGGRPVAYRRTDAAGGAGGLIAPPQPLRVVDTLGAGDVLHGAFAHHLVQRRREPVDALAAAIADAAASVAHRGPRAWAA